MEYHFSSLSVSKMIMHSLKYPSCTVNGLLIGEKKKKDNSDQLKIADCIPLYHYSHGLSVNVEIALLMVSSHCKNKNLSILGYYQANKCFYDSSPDVFAQRVAEKLFELNNDSCLVMVNNFGLASVLNGESSIEGALQMYQCVDGKWKSKQSWICENPTGTTKAVQQFVYKQKLHLDLTDMDNHLDDVSKDWRNGHLNEMITEWVNVNVN